MPPDDSALAHDESVHEANGLDDWVIAEDGLSRDNWGQVPSQAPLLNALLRLVIGRIPANSLRSFQ